MSVNESQTLHRLCAVCVSVIVCSSLALSVCVLSLLSC